MAALNAGVPVGILADQKYNEGPLVPLFGHLANTQHAPVRWAMRFGARLQPGWVERKQGARFRLYVGAPVELPRQAARRRTWKRACGGSTPSSRTAPPPGPR